MEGRGRGRGGGGGIFKTCFFLGVGTLLQVGQNFRFVGQALKVKAEKFIGPLIGLHFLSAGQLDQQKRNQGTIDLNLDAIGMLAEQVAVRHHALQSAEKKFDQPAIAVQKNQNFSGHVM